MRGDTSVIIDNFLCASSDGLFSRIFVVLTQGRHLRLLNTTLITWALYQRSLCRFDIPLSIDGEELPLPALLLCG